MLSPLLLTVVANSACAVDGESGDAACPAPAVESGARAGRPASTSSSSSWTCSGSTGHECCEAPKHIRHPDLYWLKLSEQKL